MKYLDLSRVVSLLPSLDKLRYSQITSNSLQAAIKYLQVKKYLFGTSVVNLTSIMSKSVSYTMQLTSCLQTTY